MTVDEYHDLADRTLDSLTGSLEELIEGSGPDDVANKWELDYANGVVTFTMGDHGTYVINKQPPSKQIWFSSPISGPKRFDYDGDASTWFYARDGATLRLILETELKAALDGAGRSGSDWTFDFDESP